MTATPAPVILVVEDDPDHAELVRRAFDAASWEVTLVPARTLSAATTWLAKSTPDLVIADLRLPDGDGLALVPNQADPPRYPVVIMTSYGDQRVAVEAMKTGATDYVVKSEEAFAQMPRVAQRALASFDNLVERHRAETALRAREEHFRSLIENALDFIGIVAPDGTIRYVSPSVRRLLSYEPDELVRRNILELVSTADRENAQRAVDAIFAQPGTLQSVVFRLRSRDGGQRIFEAVGAAGRDERGELQAILNSRDITDRVEAEESARRLETQLRQAQKLEMLGTLAGGIAHDFNNIVQAILGCTELARDLVPSPSPAQRYLDRVLEAAGRARHLVRQILTFSRRGDRERAEVAVGTIVEEALTLLRGSIPGNIDIQSTITSTAKVLADPTQLHQVVMNLCMNAVHAMEGDGGPLGVIVDDASPDASLRLAEGRYVRLRVRDSGHGMTEEVRERIFEPFFTTKGVGHGTGLGLSVVHGIVTGHGGALLVESEPGVGTTFDIYLPVGGGIVHEAPIATPAQLTGLRLLYVDADAEVTSVATALLESHGGHVLAVSNGKDALSALAAAPEAFDLVVLDRGLREPDSLELLHALRHLRPDLPAIVTTQYEIAGSEQALADLGRVACLAKPFRADDLARVVARLRVGPRES